MKPNPSCCGIEKSALATAGASAMVSMASWTSAKDLPVTVCGAGAVLRSCWLST
ncbi:MAG: hypothetical protein IPK23_14945 [Rhizobiales bacterium]|nr:hypothetical protein [Hyphomicrobiales bacterium]